MCGYCAGGAGPTCFAVFMIRHYQIGRKYEPPDHLLGLPKRQNSESEWAPQPTIGYHELTSNDMAYCVKIGRPGKNDFKCQINKLLNRPPNDVSFFHAQKGRLYLS